MLLTGVFKFMGVESRTGFKDPTKVNYVLGLSQGLDTIRLYVEAVDFGKYMQIPPYSDVEAELDYNPVSERVQYCMRLKDMRLLQEVKK